ncbi:MULTISPECIES: ribosome hibernation-promoting factor, HPF/YfiA family [Dehalococcoides]|uniref:Ribosome-associated translation inhibitor RaiA n=1 Tax=Dehalococcoides mccartyi TaxID=61435 RepID=A0AB38Z9J0_9CHLR|nr:ribosome-associated translation inhibitor RaiA [Dehalococcoides mccartyi]WRO07167.1 ribosome-associated translation inhibitor RaiA [Dehalococcoides mccartyi]
MEIQITTKNCRLDNRTRSYIQRKMGRITRILPQISEFRIELDEEQTRSQADHFILKATLNTGTDVLYAEERAENLLTAADRAVEVLNQQIDHAKGKMEVKARNRESIRLSQPETFSSPKEPLIRRRKQEAKPMTVEEAVNQMHLSGEEYLLFLGPDTKRVNLLRRFADGKFELVEPVPE